MQVVPTEPLAPDDVFSLRHLHKTDRTFTLDGSTSAGGNLESFGNKPIHSRQG
jgi:hypothetical protein